MEPGIGNSFQGSVRKKWKRVKAIPFKGVFAKKNNFLIIKATDISKISSDQKLI